MIPNFYHALCFFGTRIVYLEYSQIIEIISGIDIKI